MTPIGDQEFEAANRAGAGKDARGVAVSARYFPSARRLSIHLSTDVTLGIPVDKVRELAGRPDGELIDVMLGPGGRGLHFPQIDVDLSVAGLRDGLFADHGAEADRDGSEHLTSEIVERLNTLFELNDPASSEAEARRDSIRAAYAAVVADAGRFLTVRKKETAAPAESAFAQTGEVKGAHHKRYISSDEFASGDPRGVAMGGIKRVIVQGEPIPLHGAREEFTFSEPVAQALVRWIEAEEAKERGEGGRDAAARRIAATEKQSLWQTVRDAMAHAASEPPPQGPPAIQDAALDEELARLLAEQPKTTPHG